MPHIKIGLHVVAESTKSIGKPDSIPGGRPRVPVDFATVLRMREHHKMGWSRMAEAYRKQTGQFISPDTIKRRYLEAKALEKNQDDQAGKRK